ncbi:uncharacterized protein LOC143475932 [Brachyhypopomus gauderio]|uniref:uncharacterized protein LOC143475932 n=1 Tax=Brachyhypopomus gauderio TaxID=698409 RepID=UPI0040433027
MGRLFEVGEAARRAVLDSWLAPWSWSCRLTGVGRESTQDAARSSASPPRGASHSPRRSRLRATLSTAGNWNPKLLVKATAFLLGTHLLWFILVLQRPAFCTAGPRVGETRRRLLTAAAWSARDRERDFVQLRRRRV